jgi:hypothetical protein
MVNHSDGTRFSAKNSWKIRQMDTITAFLNGIIKENVYMEIPEGFPGAGDPGTVCKINCALYGLKQSPKAWYEHIDTWLTGQGLVHSEADSNMYHCIQNGKTTMILLYVDDLLITGNDESEILKLQTALANKFEMMDLSIVQNYLGAEFKYHPSGIFVHQRSYIKRILKKISLGKCNPCRLPMHPSTVLTKNMEIAKVNSQYTGP